MDNERVYFVRHNPIEGDELFNENAIISLKKHDRIGIKFYNNGWDHVARAEAGRWVPKYADLKGKYKSAVRIFCDMINEGGIVVAEYNRKNECVVGRITDHKEPTPFGGLQLTLKYEKIGEIEYANCPIMLAIRPYDTISKPKTGFFKKVIPSITKNSQEMPKLSVEDLHPKMLEQLCLEYLRVKGVDDDILEYCIMCIGSTAKTVDIAGYSKNDKRIYAQVKGEEIEKKDREGFSEFAEINKKGLNIIFSKSKDNHGKDGNVLFKPIEEVFDYFWNHRESKYRTMIKRMVGYELGGFLRLETGKVGGRTNG